MQTRAHNHQPGDDTGRTVLEGACHYYLRDLKTKEKREEKEKEKEEKEPLVGSSGGRAGWVPFRTR